MEEVSAVVPEVIRKLSKRNFTRDFKVSSILEEHLIEIEKIKNDLRAARAQITDLQKKLKPLEYEADRAYQGLAGSLSAQWMNPHNFLVGKPWVQENGTYGHHYYVARIKLLFNEKQQNILGLKKSHKTYQFIVGRADELSLESVQFNRVLKASARKKIVSVANKIYKSNPEAFK